jgi:hypothetical protein
MGDQKSFGSIVTKRLIADNKLSLEMLMLQTNLFWPINSKCVKVPVQSANQTSKRAGFSKNCGLVMLDVTA